MRQLERVPLLAFCILAVALHVARTGEPGRDLRDASAQLCDPQCEKFAAITAAVHLARGPAAVGSINRRRAVLLTARGRPSRLRHACTMHGSATQRWASWCSRRAGGASCACNSTQHTQPIRAPPPQAAGLASHGLAPRASRPALPPPMPRHGTGQSRRRRACSRRCICACTGMRPAGAPL